MFVSISGKMARQTSDLFRTFREIATVHSRELVMNDMPSYVIL